MQKRRNYAPLGASRPWWLSPFKTWTGPRPAETYRGFRRNFYFRRAATGNKQEARRG